MSNYLNKGEVVGGEYHKPGKKEDIGEIVGKGKKEGEDFENNEKGLGYDSKQISNEIRIQFIITLNELNQGK